MNYAQGWRQVQRQERQAAAIRAMYWIMTALLLAVLTLIIIMPAHAGEAEDRGQSWTAGDTALQAAVIATLAVDRAQTVYIATHGVTTETCYSGSSGGCFEKQEYYESGWARNFIGSHPTHGQVNRYFATAALLHTGVAYILPKPYRTIWQSFWIGVEAYTVQSNVNAGISVRF